MIELGGPLDPGTQAIRMQEAIRTRWSQGDGMARVERSRRDFQGKEIRVPLGLREKGNLKGENNGGRKINRNTLRDLLGKRALRGREAGLGLETSREQSLGLEGKR